MDNLVKEIATNTYMMITDAELLANPNLYYDRNDRPIYWLNHHIEAGLSYWQSRYRVTLIVNAEANGFDDFADNDKEALSTYSYGDQNSMIAYLMASQGLTQTEAGSVATTNAAVNRVNMSKDAVVIASSEKMIEIGVKYLTLIDENGEIDSSQAFSLTSAISTFMSQYRHYSVRGLNYNDDDEGIMDYFESTNSYTSGGLKNYTFNPTIVALAGSEDNARLLMVAELIEVFVKGNI